MGTAPVAKWRAAGSVALVVAALSLLVVRGFSLSDPQEGRGRKASGTPPERAHRHVPPAGSPLDRREHPRIWLTRAAVPELRAKLAGPFKTEFQGFVTGLDAALASPSGRQAEPGPTRATKRRAKGERRSRRQNLERETDILHYAFLYRIGDVPGISYEHPIARYGDHAKEELLQAVSSGSVYWPDIAYDWLHDLLTAEERAAVVGHIKRLDPKQWNVKDPWDDKSSRTVARRVLSGLAFWGDGIDDAAAERLVSVYYNDVLSGGMLDGANIIAADDGGASEGFGYSAKGNGQSSIENLLKLVEGWRTANGVTKQETYGTPQGAVFRYYPQWIAYLILPQPDTSSRSDRQYLAYKTHFSDAATPIGGKGTLGTILSALRLYKSIDPTTASLAQWLIDERVGALKGGTAIDRERALLGHFILGEKGITARSPDALGLPLTKAFDGLGWVVMRTGFTDPTDTMVTFTASPWWRSFYSNRDQNSFTIDRRGPLVINSGARTHHSYANQTWAHNTIIFPDVSAAPNTDEAPDLGGQRTRFKPTVINSQMLKSGSAYDLGGVKRLQAANPGAGLDFDYVFGDATRAYNGPANIDTRNTSKVALFTRQLVYFRPAERGRPDTLLVFDRTETTDVRYEKRWLLHPSAEPTVDGIETRERDGKWTYRQVGLITAVNAAPGSSGKLYVRTLLPARHRVVKIGGPGHEFEDPYGNNYPSPGFDPSRAGEAQYIGTYRIEVIPEEPRTSDLFLHVVEAADASSATAGGASLVQGDRIVGARVGARLAVFSRTEDAITKGEIVIAEPGQYRLLVCDLQPGAAYTVEHSGTSVSHTASPAGLVYADVDTARRDVTLSIKVSGQPNPASEPKS